PPAASRVRTLFLDQGAADVSPPAGSESPHRLGALRWSFLPLEAASPKGLTTGRVLTQLLEEWSQRVQLRTKASPVTGAQLLHGAVVVAQRLPRSIGLRAGERSFGWRPRRRGGRSGFLEERCERASKRLG